MLRGFLSILIAFFLIGAIPSYARASKKNSLASQRDLAALPSTDEAKKRVQYITFIKTRVKMWEQRTKNLRKIMARKGKRRESVQSAKESIDIMELDLKKIKFGTEKLKGIKDNELWQKGHNQIEARFRALESTYSRAMAE